VAGDYQSSPLFDERQKLAIEWAEKVTLNTARYDQALFERLSAHFSPQEIVELTMSTAMFNMINRFNDSLHVELEDNDMVDRIKRSVYVDPVALHDFIDEVNSVVVVPTDELRP
jgi:hypothetical protein